VRFACPFCTQHIACASTYISVAIDCPACGRRITVPQPLEISQSRGPMAVALPARRGFGALDLWTEEEWAEHVRGNPRDAIANNFGLALPQLPILLAVLLPCLAVDVATPRIM